MTNEQIMTACAPVAAKYGYTLRDAGNHVAVFNAKKIKAARITGEPLVEQLYAGRQNLCGSLVRNALVSALKSFSS